MAKKKSLLALNESKLDSSIGSSEIYLLGYEIIRKDRKTNGRLVGGVCFYILCKLHYVIRDDKLERLIIEVTN